jgi:hypothetical protein
VACKRGHDEIAPRNGRGSGRAPGAHRPGAAHPGGAFDEDLGPGLPRAEIEAGLATVDPHAQPGRGPALTRYTLERRILVRLRRNIHHNALGRLVRSVRRVCDVLLR